MPAWIDGCPRPSRKRTWKCYSNDRWIVVVQVVDQVCFCTLAVLVTVRERAACSLSGSYLVDPASSHMLVSKIKPCMSKYKHSYCETANGSLNQLSFIWLYLYYLDNRGNSRANTCEKSRLLEGMYLLDSKPMRVPPGTLVIHSNCSNRRASRRRCFIQISALSTVDGKVLAYHGYNGWRRIRVRFRRGSLRNGYHIQGRQQARKLPNPDSGR